MIGDAELRPGVNDLACAARDDHRVFVDDALAIGVAILDLHVRRQRINRDRGRKFHSDTRPLG